MRKFKNLKVEKKKLHKLEGKLIDLIGDSIDQSYKVTVLEHCLKCPKFLNTMEGNEVSQKTDEILEHCSYSVGLLNIITLIIANFKIQYEKPKAVLIDPRLIKFFNDTINDLNKFKDLLEA